MRKELSGTTGKRQKNMDLITYQIILNGGVEYMNNIENIDKYKNVIFRIV